MITRYDFGHPLNTDAVVQDISVSKGPMPLFDVRQEKEGLTFRVSLEPEDMIFGLGENVGGINRRGHRYAAWASDAPNHT